MRFQATQKQRTLDAQTTSQLTELGNQEDLSVGLQGLSVSELKQRFSKTQEFVQKTEELSARVAGQNKEFF